MCGAWAQSPGSTGGAVRSDPLLDTAGPTVEEILFGTSQKDVTASYRMSSRGDKSLFGYVGVPGEVALGPPVSSMYRYAGLDDPGAMLSSHWLYPAHSNSQVFTVGYTWRDLTVERSAFSSGVRRQPAERNSLKLDSRSLRLSYKPSQNWTLQLSRGSLSGIDQLVPNENVRRTTISATYRQSFEGGDWHTTLAWGRNARKFRETTMGYLLDSTLRFSGTHVVFGRLEQVGSDDLMRQNESVQTELFKMNKLTVGYFHDVKTNGSVKFDIGILASRYFIPPTMAPSYGANPTSYMVFVRLRP